MINTLNSFRPLDTTEALNLNETLGIPTSFGTLNPKMASVSVREVSPSGPDETRNREDPQDSPTH